MRFVAYCLLRRHLLGLWFLGGLLASFGLWYNFGIVGAVASFVCVLLWPFVLNGEGLLNRCAKRSVATRFLLLSHMANMTAESPKLSHQFETALSTLLEDRSVSDTPGLTSMRHGMLRMFFQSCAMLGPYSTERIVTLASSLMSDKVLVVARKKAGVEGVMTKDMFYTVEQAYLLRESLSLSSRDVFDQLLEDDPGVDLDAAKTVARLIAPSFSL